jgi:hypothetical protein
MPVITQTRMFSFRKNTTDMTLTFGPTDFRGVEYRDRGRHSAFRKAWEAAAAISAALNIRAGYYCRGPR